MMHRSAAAALLLTGIVSACHGPNPLSQTATAVLYPPGGEAYEPTVAIDPANPDHLVAAAMNGMPPVGKSTGIVVWSSIDGGRTWTTGPLSTPRTPTMAGPQVFGADVVADFAPDGTPLLESMSGVGAAMGVFLSRMPSAPDSATAAPVFLNSRDSVSGATTMYDKDWLIVDRTQGSPNRGTVYVSTGAIVMAHLPEKLGSPWQGPLASRVDVRSSHDGGTTFGPPVTVSSDSAFSAQLAVTPGGSLEVTYSHVVDMRGAATAVFHRTSKDGGATFGPPDTVAAMAADTLVDLPVLASRPNGDLLACWAQGTRRDDRSNEVRCANRPAGGRWSAPHRVETALPPGAAEAWPSIVGTSRGWYLFEFVVTDQRTEARLYRSPNGKDFTAITTLAARDSLGLAHFCVNSVTPCRRSRPDGFTQGDYTGLSAAGGRLAAAFVLPRVLLPKPDSAALHVVTMPEPR